MSDATLTQTPAPEYTGVADMRRIARELLEAGDVRVVIGWEDGRRGARPVFVTDPAAADKLIFDTRCVHNLVTYLNPRRDHVQELGKIALVVKGCDVKAVAGLLREKQIEPGDVVLIGVRCGGVLEENELPSALALTPDNVAPRCYGCDVREPQHVDHLVGESQPEPPRPVMTIDERVAQLDALPLEERWAFWTEQFGKCVRCYACRQVCPLCICERCIVEKTQPQWIEPSSHPRGNFSWNVTRALHLAGRCVDCGECERFCPVGIPLSLANRKLQQIVRDRYDYVVAEDPEIPAPIGDYRLDDQQEFIK
jgi:formate dehydrogenase (coenzyme F420) beta subunit